MGWKQDDEGFWVADDGHGVSDIGNFVDAEGEVFHVQNVGRIQAHCAEMQKGSGWSKDRTMKRYATIPLIEYLKHPGLSEDDKELDAFIASHPQYKTSDDAKGQRCPNIVIR